MATIHRSATLGAQSDRAARLCSAARVFRAGLVISCGLWVAHMMSVPIGITYDGHVYIDLAAMLGTGRFWTDWHPARTPLFPAAIRASWAALGTQPMALLVVTAGTGLLGILLTGLWVRRLAGAAAGATAMVVLSLDPVLVTYQHLVLTETGVFCLLSAAIALVTCCPAGRSASAWTRAVSLSIVFVLGYLWRQNLIVLAPVFGLAHCVLDQRCSAVSRVMQCALIVALPLVTKVVWEGSFAPDRSASVMLRYGIVKQALIDPSDPLISDREAYIRSIDACTEAGNFNSGLDGRHTDLVAQLIRWPDTRSESIFIGLVLKYPVRYALAAGRTTLLLVGAHGAVRENQLYMTSLLSESRRGAMIQEGPPAVTQAHRALFNHPGTDSWFLHALRALAPIYAHLPLPAVFVALGCGAVMSVLRRWSWAVASACVAFYLLPFTVTLSSVDRYGFPVQPIAMAMVIALSFRAVQWSRRRVEPDLVTSGGTRSPR